MPGAATQLIAVGGADPPSAPAAGDPASARRPVITIRGLSKSFNDTVIYDKFDLDLPQGEFISIFGPNGCGKSTLINMISGLMPVDAGQVCSTARPSRRPGCPTCSRTTAARCSPGCAPSTTSIIRS